MSKDKDKGKKAKDHFDKQFEKIKKTDEKIDRLNKTNLSAEEKLRKLIEGKEE